jgi:hypothetical protein
VSSSNNFTDDAWMRKVDASKEMAMRQQPETIRTVQLDYDQIVVFDGGRDARLRVLHGATWLTAEGTAGDDFVRAGDERRLADGRTLVGGLGPARLEVVERLASAASASHAWLARLRRALQRVRARHQWGEAAEPACAALG